MTAVKALGDVLFMFVPIGEFTVAVTLTHAVRIPLPPWLREVFGVYTSPGGLTAL